MAVQTSIFPFSYTDGVTATLAATTVTTVTLGLRVLFAINATQDLTITFGNATKAPTTPSATVGFRIPGGVVATFDMGTNFDRFSIFNTSASTATYSYVQLSKF